MDISLEQRLLSFLEREDESERKSFDEMRALAIEDRVLEGECIMDALCERRDARGFALRVPENLSKFREGDPVWVGDGLAFDDAAMLVYDGYDAIERLVRLRLDAFARGELSELIVGRTYCIDRRSLDIRGRLRECVGEGFATPLIRDALLGRLVLRRDEARLARAVGALTLRGLDAAQVRAGAAAIATENLALVQGPPGTGKTRLLAETLASLARAGCRIALTAFTHRAVDNALLALRAADPELILIKLVPGAVDAELQAAGVRAQKPGRGVLPARNVVVAGTCFQLAKLPRTESFHYAAFDEAGQIPIPHAIAGMLTSTRWLFFGDHAQLPPVVTGEHEDREACASIFEHLHRHHGGELLDVSYRLNDGVCRVVSELFYAGRLRAAPVAAARRMPFHAGGHLDEVLDPARAIVLARVDHLQPGQRSTEEAHLVADLTNELVRRHGVPAEQIAIIAPFRAQLRAIRSALQKKDVPGLEAIVVDTVERIQGQEREVVIVSLTAGDPDSLHARAAFFFSTNRLNVALSRARTKAIVVASMSAFEALPMEPESLRAATTFKRLARMLPCVDLSALYGSARGHDAVHEVGGEERHAEQHA